MIQATKYISSMLNYLLGKSKIKSKTVSGTTTIYGTINLGLSASGNYVVGIGTGTGSSKWAVPFMYNNAWYAKVLKDQAAYEAVISTEVTLSVYYI